jgi:hypothetical protein
MKLEFKSDLQPAFDMWNMFWSGENTRPIIMATLPKPGCRAVEPPSYLTAFDCDFNDLGRQLVAWGETHEFLGETIPNYYLEFGPDTFSAYLGCDLLLAEDRSTSWSVPFVEDWEKTEIRFHRGGFWWQRTLRAFDVLHHHLDGKMMLGAPTLVANLDALSALRGPERLLFDLIERPRQIKRALEQVCQAHSEVMAALANELDMDNIGSVNVEGLYFAGRQSRPQCDFSAMISPAMFREFVIPCLESEGRDAGAFTYHLDGPNAVCHTDALSELSALDIIIYAIGAGTEDRDWNFLYEKIDRLGKGQVFYYRMTPQKIIDVWQGYQSKKLVFLPNCTSRQEVIDLISDLENIPKQ